MKENGWGKLNEFRPAYNLTQIDVLPQKNAITTIPLAIKFTSAVRNFSDAFQVIAFILKYSEDIISTK